MRPSSKQLSFFLTPKELVTVIREMEARFEISYYQAGVFPSVTVSVISSLLDVPSLGHLMIGDWNYSPSYLIAKADADAVAREIILRKGGYSYAVDQQNNPDTVIFKPSGIFTEGILIAGLLATGSSNAYSLNTFKEISKIIKNRTRYIGSSYVGPDAEEKLKLGWRLVTAASSPKEYDLAVE